MISKIKSAGVILILTVLTGFPFSPSAFAADDIKLAGEITVLALSASALGTTLFKKDREGTVQSAKSLLLTLGTTFLLKYTVNGERPDGGSHSFPSGHTSVAFSRATFLQKRYGWEYGAPAFVAASFVGWSRIESDRHYFRDVLAGAAIGVISAYIFTDAYREKIVVTPFMGEGTYGMLLQTAF